MWLLIFVGTFACGSVSGNAGIGAVFRKCCPKNQSLVKVSDFNVKSEIYECLTREEVEKQYNVSNSPLIIGDNVSVDYGMPKLCDGLEIFQLSPEELDTYASIENESCYERLVAEVINGSTQHNIPRVVALTCFRNETKKLTETNLTIEQMRKCCPKGQSYDTRNHICKVTDDNTEGWVIENIQKNVSSDFIYEMAYGLHCKYVEVELTEDKFDLYLQGSSLNVLKKNGEGENVISRGEWCIDREYRKPGLIARVCTQDCSSYGAYCLRKCCPFGQHYTDCSLDNKCVPNDEEIPFDTSVYTDDLKDIDVLGISTAELLCPEGIAIKSYRHHLTPQGTLNSTMANDDLYCMETCDSHHSSGGNITLTVYICFVGWKKDNKFQIKAVIKIISSVCLAVTLIVYLSQAELRNLHGKMLICHASMMLLAFSCLARAQYTEVRSDSFCITLGYVIYFGFTAAFAWLNVMCVDIWSTLTSMERRRGEDEWRRFLWYSLYAWSVALCLTLTVLLLDLFHVADFLDANMGFEKCWFGKVKNETDWPRYIFFVIPMGLITCTNFVLFLLTAHHCALVKSEVEDHLAKYVLTGKLWVVMGAGWIAELLSTLISEPKWLWAIFDHINELQGVFIFLVLICKPKLYYRIRRCLRAEVHNAPEPGTLSTNLSRSKGQIYQTDNVVHSKRAIIMEA